MRRIAILTLIICLITSAAFCAKKGAKKMEIKSAAFKDQSYIPVKYTCAGNGTNPPLLFENVPAKAKSLVLIVEDPDAVIGTFYHWAVADIPVEMKMINENTEPQGTAVLGTSGKTGYRPPCPPPGKVHHYIFNLYALDKRLDLPENNDIEALQSAMSGHIISKASLTGLFKR